MDLIDIFLHLDKYLNVFVDHYGFLVYFILFIIIFCETGLVVTPFLPGDSLLFATGALAATGSINLIIVFVIFCIAAILGDSMNYSIGHLLKNKVLTHQKMRFIKTEHIDRTNAFYEKHGGKTIIIARFVPIIRTFAPFVAGVGAMAYKKFILFNVVGGISWVCLALFSGYFFGNIPFVKDNFSIVIIGIVVVSMIPIAVTFISSKIRASKGPPCDPLE